MLGFAFRIDEHAGVIDGAGAGIALDIADHACAVAKVGVRSEHRFEPTWREHEIVVQQAKKAAAGDSCTAIVGGGVAEISLVENDADVGSLALAAPAKVFKPGAGAVGATVVDQNYFVGEISRERGLQASDAGLGEREAVVERNDEADLHGGATMAGSDVE